MRDTISRSFRDALPHLQERGVDIDALTHRAELVRSGGKIASENAEVRAWSVTPRSEGDTVVIEGYAATWGVWYDVAGGPPHGWRERIQRGAIDKSLRERDDVRLLINHEGVALARTADGTLEIRSDDIGIWFRAEVDARRTDARDLVYAIESGNVDQCSWAFLALAQEWNEDYTERTITEAKQYDVSVVTYPANEATIVAVRRDADGAAVESRATEYRTVDLTRFSPRQVQQYEDDERLAGIHGKYDQTDGPEGAHYVPASPFRGLNCAACAFYEGPRGCEIVDGDIDPAGVCKRWIIPADLMPATRSGLPLSLALAQAALIG